MTWKDRHKNIHSGLIWRGRNNELGKSIEEASKLLYFNFEYKANMRK